MIQRIQSLYLLIVTALLIAAMCLPMGYFIDTTGEHPFKALGIDVNGTFQSTWGIFGILMLSALVAFATIFLYKNRMLHLFRIGWALCLPLVSIVLNVLAIRAIGRDEVMVKAADRLR